MKIGSFFSTEEKYAGRTGSLSVSGIFLGLLVAILVLGYIVPVAIHHSPWGSDVFTHIYSTDIMSQADSLSGFYDKAINAEYSGYDYPFGMWYYGAIVMKVTGLDVFQLSIVLPFCLLFVLLIVFYSYAEYLLADRTKAIVSLVFLLSMPAMALGILNYSTSRFVSIFIIMIIFFALIKEDVRNYLVILILVLTLTFTHTGSFLFLTFFAIAYFLFNALIWKRFDRSIYILIVSSLFLYIYIMQIFPFVQPQYIDKGRLILSITNSLSNGLNLEIIRNMGQIFYDNIFVSSNFSYAIFWSCMLFVLAKFLIYVHVKVRAFIDSHNYFAFPILSSISNISHGIVSTPLWVGPIHTVLSVFGVFRLNQKGLCIALALVFSSLFPGAIQTSEGTGALREISYLYLIIPITATAGFFALIDIMHTWTVDGKVRRTALLGIYAIIIIPITLTPIAANMYYAPQISITPTEDLNLRWLSTIGNPFEGVPDYVYRERIDMYANKTTPSIPSGSEMSRYLKDLNAIYLYESSEEFAKDLSSFNIQYVIVSDRVIKSLNSDTGLPQVNMASVRIDNDTYFNRIYSSADNFSVYQFINPPPVERQPGNVADQIYHTENTPRIQEYGSTFLIENDYYKVRVNQGTPDIRYIGTRNNNILGEGMIDDSVTVYWTGLKNETINEYLFSNLTNSTVTIQNNMIKYKSILKSEDGKQDWATLYVNYIFYEKAFKREILVTSDRTDMGFDTSMHATHDTSVFSPIKNFVFNDIESDGESWKNRQIFPSQDPVILKDKKINKVFLNSSDSGVYIQYADTLPYPTTLMYKGDLVYDYSLVAMSTGSSLESGEPMKEVQYISVGTKDASEENIKNYQSVTLLDFPNAIHPAIVFGTIPMYKGNLSVQPVERNATPALNQTPYILTQSHNQTLKAYSVIQNDGLAYTECIPSSSDVTVPRNINTAAFIRLYENQTMLPVPVQEDEIRSLQRSLSSHGFSIMNYQYNLETIRLLSQIPSDYLFSPYVSPPSDQMNREGTRDLKFAYYQGNRTDLVLIPVTGPSSIQLNYRGDPDSLFVAWNETLGSVISDGGIAALQWNSEDIGNPVFTRKFLDFTNSSRQRGITFTTPDTIADHYQKIQRIFTNVTRTIDTVDLEVTNMNPVSVDGVAYAVILPKIDDACPYRTSVGTILATEQAGNDCRISVGVDVAGNSEETIRIEPDIPRKEFQLNTTGFHQGWNTVQVLDTNKNPIPRARITVRNNIYLSNEKGEAAILLTRGKYPISIEKEGFAPVSYPVDVKGWLTQILYHPT